MTGQLEQAIRTLLGEALPGLFGGEAPAVQLSLVPDVFTIDPQSSEVEPAEPRTDDQTDVLPFNPAVPAGPYTLTLPPVPGPRRVRLTTNLGDRIPLATSEVRWDSVNPRVFTLNLRADRDLAGVNGVQALYGVTAVFLQLKAVHKFALQLQSGDPGQLQQAEALAIAAIELNRNRLAEQAAASFTAGDYGARIALQNLKLLEGSAPSASTRLLRFSAEIELKATRALGADEGKPIVRIRTPGPPVNPNRPVDIIIGVD